MARYRSRPSEHAISGDVDKEPLLVIRIYATTKRRNAKRLPEMMNINILIVNNQGAPPEPGPRSPAQDAWQLMYKVDSIPGVASETISSGDIISDEQLAGYGGVILSGSPRDLLMPNPLSPIDCFPDIQGPVTVDVATLLTHPD